MSVITDLPFSQVKPNPDIGPIIGVSHASFPLISALRAFDTMVACRP
jgi:hypothetical protein